VFGEYDPHSDVPDPDHPHFDADIGVGRAPVHNEADVANFIKKNLSYAHPKSTDNWLGQTLLGMGEAFSGGSGLGVGYDIIRDNYGKTNFYGMFEYDKNHVYNNDCSLLDCDEY